MGARFLDSLASISMALAFLRCRAHLQGIQRSGSALAKIVIVMRGMIPTKSGSLPIHAMPSTPHNREGAYCLAQSPGTKCEAALLVMLTWTETQQRLTIS